MGRNPIQLVGHLFVLGLKKIVYNPGKVAASFVRDVGKIPKIAVAATRAAGRKFIGWFK